VGAIRKFVHRESLTPQTFGHDARAHLLKSSLVPADLIDAWKAVTEQALQLVEACYARCEVKAIRLHGDCHPGNILWTPDGPHFVDLDDSRMGPAMQDLWMLLSGDRASMSLQLREVLKGYEQFMAFDRSELNILEALRTLRLIHYSAWIARRWDDPAFPAAFPWFNTQRYWQDRILELREQIALMQEEPLVVD
jgi:Ser/Thr protein kinase RdoA (MazF antagonist)